MSMPAHAWMVRSNYLEDPEQVRHNRAVVIGWAWMEDLTALTTRDMVRRRYDEADPDRSSPQRALVNASQLYRFAHEIRPGDYLLTYLRGSREILIGVADGAYEWNTALFGEWWPHVRRVKWLKSVSRDAFTQPARNSLGSTLTVFCLDSHLPEIHRLAAGETNACVPAPLTAPAEPRRTSRSTSRSSRKRMN